MAKLSVCFMYIGKHNKITCATKVTQPNIIKERYFSFKKKNEFKNKFPEKWLPAHFQIVEEAFSEENKMINSTMKMVRFAILNAFQDRIDLMYGPNAQQNSTEKNKQVLEKMFKL